MYIIPYIQIIIHFFTACADAVHGQVISGMTHKKAATKRSLLVPWTDKKILVAVFKEFPKNCVQMWPISGDCGQRMTLFGHPLVYI